MTAGTADRVLAALRDVYARDGRATLRSVAQAAGLSLGPTHTHLRDLRDSGLVAFQDGASGTLRLDEANTYRPPGRPNVRECRARYRARRAAA